MNIKLLFSMVAVMGIILSSALQAQPVPGFSQCYVGVAYGSSNGQTAIAQTDTLPGDVNLDGRVDFLDLGPFLAVVISGEYQVEADIDL